MNTVLFEVATVKEMQARIIAQLCSGKPDKYARISFESAAQMARIMTPLRWDVVAVMTGAGELGIRELARRVNRDVSAVHADVSALVTAGVVDRTTEGKYLFPYEHVKVKFELHKAA